MTTTFAMGALAIAALCGAAFVWWVLSGATGLMDHDDHGGHDD